MENTTSTTSSDSLSATICNSIQALGRGFDVTSDIRLLYCKGAPGSRIVHLDEEHNRDLVLSQELVVSNVSSDIDFSRGKSGIEKTPVCSFEKVIVFVFRIFICFVDCLRSKYFTGRKSKNKIKIIFLFICSCFY